MTRQWVAGARGQERGSVLPLVTIMMLMLFGFAAIGVDASAAYAEKRQAQSAADAGAIAGALLYLDPSSATPAAIAQQVKDFVALNAPGVPPTDADWTDCTDSTKPIGYAPLEDPPGTPISDCISLKQVADAPALLRVSMPNWDMPTSFAGLIGFLSSYSLVGTLVWIVVILVSVLVHEMGHALTGIARTARILRAAETGTVVGTTADIGQLIRQSELNLESVGRVIVAWPENHPRSEEHTSELQSH